MITRFGYISMLPNILMPGLPKSGHSNVTPEKMARALDINGVARQFIVEFYIFLLMRQMQSQVFKKYSIVTDVTLFMQKIFDIGLIDVFKLLNVLFFQKIFETNFYR